MAKAGSRDLAEKAKDFSYNIVKDRVLTHQEVIRASIMVVGGSVSLGLADEESDIDFGIIFPTHDDYIRLGSQVVKDLGGRFHKYEGVLIDVHLCSLLSLGVREQALSDEWWIGPDPTDIFFIQHAIIIQDPKGTFRSLKARVKEIPSDILKRRIIGRWGFLSMWVDFVRQCLKRRDEIGSFTFAARAVQETMMLGFLLNGLPYPDPKYRYRLFRDLPELSEGVIPVLEHVVSTTDMESRYNLLAEVIGIYSTHMRKNEVINVEYIDDWLQCFDIRGDALF